MQDSLLCLLPPDTGEDRVQEIWSLLGTKPALDRVFSAVSGGLGTNLADMPAFGVLSLGERRHVLLRGPLELQQAGHSEPAASGEFVTTWSERVLSGPGRFTMRVTAPAVAGAPGAGMLLPLESGIALVSVLEFDSTQDAGPRAGAPARSLPGAGEPGETAPVEAAPVVVAAPPAATEPVAVAAAPVPPDPAVSAGHAPDADVREPGRHREAPRTPEAAEAENPDLGLTVRPPEETEAPAETVDPRDTLQPTASLQSTASLQTAASASPAGQLIDSVPWLRNGAAAAAPAAPKPAPAPAPPAPAPVPAPPAPAPVPTPPAPAPVPAPPAATGLDVLDLDDADLDHDGDTIMSSDLAKVLPPPAPDSRPNTAPTVLARTCPSGHANPPTRSVCVLCGQPLGEDPQPLPRPSLGTAVFSTGQVEPLDKNMVIGRQPSVARTPGSVMPRMVQVPSSGGDISRSHAEIRLEGWHVMLRDLNSTNGTVMVREGQLPHRLGQSEAVIVLDGDVAELGDGVWVRFEGLA
ncbi:FHA domain-containing protein [Arthrobacter sp. zg-Y20]|uniref:FHA domain-containing protein n=1 Tax=Arthrobacter sp. zg-Y20 TaxID=2886938 RepID=UPI0024DFB1C2|nr:FHA domain-containing protein [Arthrobacter sp. zg-Y20]MCC3277287.1 FHA domain-containing protein [Arthrobacter sp. zg-Y20]MDK1317447.1 FHA domain-containing protein [Arthrobacter sp. zg.Y20]WIB07219.1 FHA domain-containing protein [Arthrobacter sp. zg-Y20]